MSTSDRLDKIESALKSLAKCINDSVEWVSCDLTAWAEDTAIDLAVLGRSTRIEDISDNSIKSLAELGENIFLKYLNNNSVDYVIKYQDDDAAIVEFNIVNDKVTAIFNYDKSLSELSIVKG